MNLIEIIQIIVVVLELLPICYYIYNNFINIKPNEITSSSTKEEIKNILPLLQKNINDIGDITKQDTNTIKTKTLPALRSLLLSSLSASQITDPLNKTNLSNEIQKLINQLDNIDLSKPPSISLLNSIKNNSTNLVNNIQNIDISIAKNDLQDQIDIINRLDNTQTNSIDNLKNNVIPDLKKILETSIFNLSSNVDSSISSTKDNLQKQIDIINDVSNKQDTTIADIKDVLIPSIKTSILNLKQVDIDSQTELKSSIDYINKLDLTQTSSINEIKNIIIPDIKNTLENSINNLDANTKTNITNLQNNIQKQIDNISSLNTENINEIKNILIPSVRQSISDLDSLIKVNNEDIKTKLNSIQDNLQSQIYTINSLDLTQSSSIDEIKNNIIPDIKKNLENSIDNLDTNSKETKNILQKQIDDLNVITSSNINDIKDKLIPSLQQTISQIGELHNTEITNVNNKLNDMKTSQSTKELIINVPLADNSLQNWSISGDGNGNLCLGKPDIVACINSITGDLYKPKTDSGYKIVSQL